MVDGMNRQRVETAHGERWHEELIGRWSMSQFSQFSGVRTVVSATILTQLFRNHFNSPVP